MICFFLRVLARSENLAYNEDERCAAVHLYFRAIQDNTRVLTVQLENLKLSLQPFSTLQRQ